MHVAQGSRFEVQGVTHKGAVAFDELSPEQKAWLRYADSDYVAARVLYRIGAVYLKTVGLCHEGLEKYLKLFLFLFEGVQKNCEEYLGKKDLLGNNGHNLVKLRETCVLVAQADRLASLVFSDQLFKRHVNVFQKLRYSTATRYPTPTVVSGYVVQIFDGLTYSVRQDCLKIKETPLQVVCDRVGSGPGWPPLNRDFLTDAFYHENAKFQRDHAPRTSNLEP